MKKSVVFIILIAMFTSTGVKAAEVPRESAPCNATNEAIIVVGNFIGDILTEVENGLGYADARAKSNRVFLMPGSTVRQTVIAMASLLTSPMLQYGNTGICTCDLIAMLIILKKSELLSLP